MIVVGRLHSCGGGWLIIQVVGFEETSPETYFNAYFINRKCSQGAGHI